jgi:tetratricopeptide (TPR) repeat protein
MSDNMNCQSQETLKKNLGGESMKKLAVVTMILLLSAPGSVYPQTEVEMKVWSLLDAGEIESAMDILDNLGATSNILKLSKARAYYMMEQYDKSIDMLDDLVENTGLNDSDLFDATTKSLCLLYLGKNYVEKGDMAKGKSHMRRALSLKPMEFAYDLAAKALAELGDNYGLEAKERLLNRNTPNQHGIEQCGGILMDVVVLVVESKGDPR